MKIYLASDFSLADEVEIISNLLEQEGHEILVKWWRRRELKNKFQTLSPDRFYAQPECKEAYEMDYQGVKDCDLLILVSNPITPKFCGANVEVGMAYAWGKPVYSLYNIQNSAMYYPVKRCLSLIELFQELRAEKNE